MSIFRLKKINVINYVPHNLEQYIALRTQCPSKRALLEKHFIVKKVRKETKEDCEGSAAQVEARRETATQEVANKVAQDSNERVAVVDKTSSEKNAVQDTVKISNETSGAKIVSEKSSLTSTNVQNRTSSSETAVSRDAQSKLSEQSATVVSSQSTKSKTDVTTTEMRETNAIDATNQATAKVFFTRSSKVIDIILLLILFNQVHSLFRSTT